MIRDSKHLQTLSAFANTHNVTRREFLNRAAAVGVTASVATAIWNERSFAATPNRGGHAVLGVATAATSDTLDPSTTPSDHSNLMRNSIGNTLMEITPEGELEGDLASDWEASSDVKEWVFTLREGVEFHNGKTLTPEDVIASINLHRGEESKSGGKSLMSSVEEMTADGNKIRFKLSGGSADFPYYLTQYFFLIMPSKDGGVDPTSGVGTGPFTLEDYEPGVRGTVKRNPNYHKDGLPYFDSVEVLAIADNVARTNALTTGQIHAMDKVDTKIVDLLGKVSGVNVETVATGTHYTMPMLMDTAPYDNVDARLALKYLVNRDEMVNKVLGGYATLGNDHPIGPEDPFFNTDLAQREIDIDKAKHHLKKSGLSSLTVKLHASDGVIAGAVDTAVLFKEAAQKAGIDVEVARVPSDGYWSNVWNQVPFCVAYWNGRPTADLMFTTAYYSEAAWNDSRFKNAEFDKLLVAARTELDFNKRKDLYWEMQAIMKDQASTIIPAFVNHVYGISDKIGHAKISGARWWDKARATERWWLKA